MDECYDSNLGAVTRGSRTQTQRRTVIKFAKIPEHESTAVGTLWNTQSDDPNFIKLRRVTSLEDITVFPSSRSLKNLDSYCNPLFVNPSFFVKRKLTTIVEKEDNSERSFKIDTGVSSTRNRRLIPKKNEKAKTTRSCSIPSSGGSPASSQNLSRRSILTKCENEIKASAKLKTDEKISVTAKMNYKSKLSQSHKIISSKPCKLLSPESKDKDIIDANSNSFQISPPKRFEIFKKFVKPKPTQSSPTIKRKITPEINKKSHHLEYTSETEKILTTEVPILKSPVKPKSLSSVGPKVDTTFKKKFKKDTCSTKNSCDIQENKFKTIKNKEDETVTSTYINVRANSCIVKGIDNSIPDDSHTSLKPEMKNQTTETSPDYALYKLKYDTREIEIQTEEVSTTTVTELQGSNLNLSSEIDNDNVESNNENPLDTNDIPMLQIPPFRISPRGKLKRQLDELSLNGNMNKSIIIGKATVTYTRKKKINFQVVGTSETDQSSLSPTTPICVRPYPFTVMSVLKRELENTGRFKKERHSYEKMYLKDICSWPEDLFRFETSENSRKKLVKPSDLIQKIQSSTECLNSNKLSEQFHRELNFIDSFFDSLQFLENNCVVVNNQRKLQNDMTLSSDNSDLQCLTNCKVLSKLDNEQCEKNNSPITANKSLCLLNLLLKEERRRAKNLIFVLKMREDALKDFTKSQILYLEKKKRSEEEDVSTLKKKQRGALLKLQQECGEMHRMKKALLALSEQRQNALIQTKRNIELKVASDVEVHQLLNSNKNKLRPFKVDNVRAVIPVKCFDLCLSSIHSDDSLNDYVKNKIETGFVTPKEKETVKVEKSIQTSDSIIEEVLVDSLCPLTKVVKVDGAYLNILFHNLALPQMFSGGKDYEVCEIALQNILKSADRLQEPSHRDNKLIKEKTHADKDLSKSSTPSTARSLVDEFDEYFSYLGKAESIGSSGQTENSISDDQEKNHEKSAKSDVPAPSDSSKTTDDIFNNNEVKSNEVKIEVSPQIESEIKEVSPVIITKVGNNTLITTNKKNVPVTPDTVKDKEDTNAILKNDTKKNYLIEKNKRDEMRNIRKEIKLADLVIPPRTINRVKKCDSSTNTNDIDINIAKPIENNIQIRKDEQSILPLTSSLELPIRKREVNVIRSIESLKTQLTRSNKQDSSTNTYGPGGLDDLPLRKLSTVSEEEELRKKQLAIELEIKALEQQFIVREIPDKPPPPYTPPATETSTGTQTAPIVVDVLSTKERVTRAVDSYCDQLYPDPDEETASRLKPADSLEELVLDFCVDSIKKLKIEKSDEPWHPTNMLPPKLNVNKECVVAALTEEACQILGMSQEDPLPIGPPIINKRSDYIDDILFSEWRKCEVEWTALEADEVSVQNQLFKSIYQKVLDDSIEEYKSVIAKSIGDTDK